MALEYPEASGAAEVPGAGGHVGAASDQEVVLERGEGELCRSNNTTANNSFKK